MQENRMCGRISCRAQPSPYDAALPATIFKRYKHKTDTGKNQKNKKI